MLLRPPSGPARRRDKARRRLRSTAIARSIWSSFSCITAEQFTRAPRRPSSSAVRRLRSSRVEKPAAMRSLTHAARSISNAE
jgi:hypothetical protein